MASIYRRTRSYPIPSGAEIVTDRKGQRFAKWVDNKTGRTRKAPLNAAGDAVMVESGSYLIAYFDAGGKRQEVNSKTTDLATAERIAGQLENKAALRQAGIIDPTQERFSNEARRPLVDHIEDYRRFLASKGNTPKHVESTLRYIEIVCQRTNAKQVSDLNGAAVLQVVGELRNRGISKRTQDGAGPRTANAYLTAIKGFSRWLWRERRTPVDALATLPRFNEETDRRHVRRELTPDEAVYLLGFVEGYTTKFHNMPGPVRAIAYRLALGSGLRAGELRSLTPAHFDLDADPATVTVDAAYSKRRRLDVQPIRQDLAELLRPWLAGYGRDDHPLANMPDNTARMLQQDLAAARRKWIDDAPTDAERQQRERSDFLAYQDADGRVVDFHATRHTYISGIVAGGASVKTCQELARHSTPTLTIGRYSHARLHDLTAALDALPDLATPPETTTAETLTATGTDNLTPVSTVSILPANRQQYGSETMQETANCGERPDDCSGTETAPQQAQGERPNVLKLQDLAIKKPHPAGCGGERRARESNPQPAKPASDFESDPSPFGYPPAVTVLIRLSLRSNGKTGLAGRKFKGFSRFFGVA